MSDRDEKQSDPGFRVVDRRRFTDEGTARADVEEREKEPAADTATSPTQAQSVRSETDKAGKGDRSPPLAGQTRPPIDFLTFAVSLATNALAALGLLPKEQAHGLPKSPELAREYIDILAMLQEKTRGNLSPQEAASLTQLLTDLRLQYVESTRRR